jgi:predicted nucleic acid-binding protein
MRLTIDASVFIAAARTTEPNFASSGGFLKQARAILAEVICPVLVLPECSAAITRRTSNPALALTLITAIEGWPDLQLIQLTSARARRAAQLAATHRLRGADSIFLATAEEFTTLLVTWDDEMLQRGAAVVTVITPADWLSANQPNTSHP